MWREWISSLRHRRDFPSPTHSNSLPKPNSIVTSIPRALIASPSPSKHEVPSYLGQRVVLYYTSLHVVRRTFEDCRAVKSILQCFQVTIEERDDSIDDHFRDEFHGILGFKNVTLPRVFIGGVEEVKEMLENGKLSRLIKQSPKASQIGCDCCGGFRFVVCDECSGSHKVFTEKNGFKSCSSCNSNGLIRCPVCF